MKGGTGAVDGFDTCVVYGGSATGDLAVVCLEEDVGVFIDICITATNSCEIADVISDMVEYAELQNAYAGVVVEAQDGDC